MLWRVVAQDRQYIQDSPIGLRVRTVPRQTGGITYVAPRLPLERPIKLLKKDPSV